MGMKLVILEDNEERQAVMRSLLADRFYTYDIHIFDEADAMIRFLNEYLADTLVIALDHDLEMKPGSNGQWIDPGTGRMVADYLAKHSPVCPVIIHTTNAVAAEGMKAVLKDAGWKTRRVIPFDDLQWIETDWFPAIRRAIVGPIRHESSSRRE